MASIGDKQSSNNAQTNYVSLLFTDPKLQVLQCVGCNTTLTISAFQSSEHAACSSCSERRWAFEKVLESVKIVCQYRELGCREIRSYKDKNDHEKVCKHAPLTCPLSGCDFVSSTVNIYQHFKFKHGDRAHYFQFNDPFTVELKPDTSFSVLYEENISRFYVLHQRKDPLGSLIWLSCVFPRHHVLFEYSVTFVCYGTRKLTMEVYTTSTIRGRVSDNDLPAEFLLVPSSLVSTPGNMALEICVFYPYRFLTGASKSENV